MNNRSQLSETPRQTLQHLIATYGLSLCDNPMRCRGLLLDTCGEYRREINILVNALEEHVNIDLLTASKALPYQSLRARLVRRLYDNRGLDENFAGWAVDTWALALGVISHTASTSISTIDLNTDSLLVAPVHTPLPLPGTLTGTSATTSTTGNTTTTKRKPIGCLLLSGLVILVISASFIGFSSYQNNVRQTNALATTTAHAHSTATAIAHINGTATAYAQATASVIAANPYPSYLPGNGTLAFYDSLSQPYQWYSESDSSFGGDCQFSNGAYHISESKAYNIYLCDASSTFIDFAIEVQMNISQGDCGGIDFRADESSAKDYIFRVCQDGTYTLFSFSDNTHSNRLASSSSSAISTGTNQSNIISVVAKGSTLNLYVNQQTIGSVNDSTYSQGYIGLIAEDLGSFTKVIYTNARIWTL